MITTAEGQTKTRVKKQAEAEKRLWRRWKKRRGGGRGIKNKTKNILTLTFSHLQFTNLSTKKESPPFFLPGDSASKGERLVQGRSPGRRQSCQTHHHLLGPSSPDTAVGKPLASATPSWYVLSRGHGSARDPSSGPKSPHGGSQDHGMEQKKVMM